MVTTSASVSQRAERFVGLLRRYAASIIVLTVLLCLGCAALMAQLQLKTDFAELLPSHDPSVQELRRLQAALPGSEVLIINIKSQDRAANMRFADDLVAKLRTLPKELVGLAVANIKDERRWFEERQGLYLKVADLEALRDKLKEEVHRQKNPFYVDLEGGETLEQMHARIAGSAGASLGASLVERFPDGYFMTRDGTVAMVVVMPPGGIFHEHAGEHLRDEVQGAIDGLDPTRYGIHEVGYSGDIESSLEERDALENDLVWATGLCVLLVCIIVTLFFGRLRAIPLMAIPACVGTAVAYAVAELSFGYLNSSTAFLASIIIGNGINFAIIQLARYEEERRHGALPAEALTRAVALTVQATAIAALAASISYGSLTVTQFRGFSQFGIIGGVGMVVSWLATIIVLPCVLWLLDRHETQPLSRSTSRAAYFAEPFARFALRSPRVLVVTGAVLTLAALLVLPRYLRDPFEYNFRNLRSAVSDDTHTGEARWYAANGEVFGRALNPLVVLTHRPAEAEATRQALWRADKRDGGAPMLDKIVLLDDLLPGPVAEQAPKLPILREIRAIMTDPVFKALPA
ncbi:MAG TPA: MMPL family transporter, partial [Myxococcota bacterium]|nr:MMPL family transporter [Myxococcota bacterium]